MAGSSISAAAQVGSEGQKGKTESAQGQYVISLLELSRQPQLPDRAEGGGGDNRLEMPPARPLPADAETGVIWPPLGRAAATSTLSLTATTSASSSPLPSQLLLGGIDNDKAIPPDTDGAVGPSHVVSMLNDGVFVSDRLGTPILQASLATFWASANQTGTFPFDPKIMYDPTSARWIASATAGEYSTSSGILVAMSVTSDPTGAWVMFETTADPTGTAAADAPLLGFTKDWVVVSVNMMNLSDGTLNSTKIFVFNKSDLANGSAIRVTTFTDPTAFALMPAATYDPTVSTMYLVQDWNGNSGGIGTLRISTITGPVGSETYKATNTFPSSANTWQTCKLSCQLGNFATQLGSTQKIAIADSRVSSAVYQNGSLWVAQNASIPAVSPDHTTAQWWQITSSGVVQQFGRVDGGTGTFYGFPTAVANSNGDMLIGFTSFSSSEYATAAYAYRAASDAPGTLRNVVEYKPGENFYYRINATRDDRNRWGDYSSTVVDPVNGLDMWTLQEYAASPDFIVNGVSTSRWGTYWAKVSPSSNTVVPESGWWWDPNLQGTGFFIEYGGNSGHGLFIGGFLYDANGKSQWLVASSGVNGTLTSNASGLTYSGNWLKCSNGQSLTSAWKQNSCATDQAMSISFSDATDATMTRPDGSKIQLVRFPFTGSATFPAPQAGSPQNGWWWVDPANATYNPGPGGTGYGIEIQGSSAFIVAYVYDPSSGNPIWYLTTSGSTTMPTPTTYNGTWNVYTGGPQWTSPEGTWNAAIDSSYPGVGVALNFTDATHGTMTMGNVVIPIVRFQSF